MRTIRVLVFPCGSEIGLEYHRALGGVRYIDLCGASSVSDHGEFAYEQYIGDAPYVSDPSFGKWLKAVVIEKGIDVVVPAMDSVIPVLARLAPSLGCKALVPSAEVADICRDKALTYRAFASDWFNPGFYENADDVPCYPVAIKPAKGQGSQGFKVMHSHDELLVELKSRSERQVICEYLSGPEYTIDCFSDRHGELRFAMQRIRERTKAGISVRSHNLEPDPAMREIALAINERLHMRGVWFFQLKRNDAGGYRLLEVAPRVAGTMCLERALGVNLPALAILDLLDFDVNVDPIPCSAMVDRAFENRYRLDFDYNTLYLDYDDTLVCEGNVNLEAIQLVYQCHNAGVPVVLLTRHDADIHDALGEACIDEGLFEQVLHLDRQAKKSDYIDASRNPVFVDDSFAERFEVSRKLGIPAYGPESLEVLLGTGSKRLLAAAGNSVQGCSHSSVNR